MRADNTAHLITAAQRRHELTRAKAIQTLRELNQAGSPITFEAVARHAGISRSWLYTQPDIKDQIHHLRALGARTSNTGTPSRQRCTDASLRQRLTIANDRNRDLADENLRLRRQLEQVLGQLRATRPPSSRIESSTHIDSSHSDNDRTPGERPSPPATTTLTTPSTTQTRRSQS